MALIIRSLVFFTLCILVAPSWAQDASDKQFLYPIPDINKGIDKTFFSMEGYVAFVSVCPKCPDGSVCVPCDNRAIVTDNLEAFPKEFSIGGDKATPLSVNDIVLIINPAQNYEVGKKYMLLIQNQGTAERPVYYVTDYHELPEAGSKGDSGK